MGNLILKNKKIGFTVIELLVSIGIFIVITVIALASFRGGTVKGELKLARDQIVNDLRDLRSSALSGEEICVCMYEGGIVGFCSSGDSCQPSDSPEFLTPAGGYGLHIALCDSPPCSYILYADLNQNQEFDAGETLSGGNKEFSNNILVSEFRSYSAAGDNLLDSGPIDIVFAPYNSDINIISGGIISNTNSNINTNTNSNINSNTNSGSGDGTTTIYRKRIVLKIDGASDEISFIINSGSGTIIEGE